MSPLALGSLYSLAAAMAWAVSVVLFKRLGETMAPVALNLFKSLVGLLALAISLPLVAPSGARAFNDDAVTLFWSGVFGIGLADVWLFAGLNRLGASLQAVADGLYAPAVMVWAFVLLGDVPTTMDLCGGGLVLAGIALISVPTPGRVVAPQRGRQLVVGLAYSAAATALMALAIVWIMPALSRHDIVHATMVRMLGGVLALLAYLVFDAPARRQALAALRPSQSYALSVPASLLGTYVAVMLWMLGYKYAPANVAAILNQTSVLFLAVLAAVLLREPLTLRGGVAVALGFAGSVLVLLR